MQAEIEFFNRIIPERTFTCGVKVLWTPVFSPDLVSDQELGNLFLGGNRLD